MKPSIERNNLLIVEFYAECEFEHRIGNFYVKKQEGRWKPPLAEGDDILINSYPLTDNYSITYCINIEELNFHKSWDRLVPVINKLNEVLPDSLPREQDDAFFFTIQQNLIRGNISKVWESIVNLIKWYNKIVLEKDE